MRKIFKLNEEKKNDLWCTHIEQKFRFLIIDSNENRIERKSRKKNIYRS